MGVERICRCGTVTRDRVCPRGCQRADDRRRHERQRTHGRDTRAWRRLALAAKIVAGFRCQHCGSAEDPSDPRTKLTVHLDPALEGNHAIATLADVEVVCASEHGSIDAPRSTGGSAQRPAGVRPPRASLPRETSTTRSGA